MFTPIDQQQFVNSTIKNGSLNNKKGSLPWKNGDVNVCQTIGKLQIDPNLGTSFGQFQLILPSGKRLHI
jgi:hypothetical protein